MKSGFITVLGRTNVGKSTILNALIGKKVAITTPKKQTTRTLIRAILTKDDVQMVFIDTPGIHKPRYALGEEMNKKVHRALREADVAVLVVDAGHPFNEGDELALNNFQFNCPLIIVFNKIDTTTFVLMEHLREKYQELYPEAIQIETSAIRNFNIDLLEKTIYDLLPEGPMYYPADYMVDTTEEFQMTEIIREKTMLFTREEIPHAIAVSIDKIEHYDDGIDVYASINVEKDSQKGIIIGKGGTMIKKIRHAAQHEIHRDLKLPVRLELFVKVYPNWRNSPKALKELHLLEE